MVKNLLRNEKRRLATTGRALWGLRVERRPKGLGGGGGTQGVWRPVSDVLYICSWWLTEFHLLFLLMTSLPFLPGCSPLSQAVVCLHSPWAKSTMVSPVPLIRNIHSSGYIIQFQPVWFRTGGAGGFEGSLAFEREVLRKSALSPAGWSFFRDALFRGRTLQENMSWKVKNRKGRSWWFCALIQAPQALSKSHCKI